MSYDKYLKSSTQNFPTPTALSVAAQKSLYLYFLRAQKAGQEVKYACIYTIKIADINVLYKLTPAIIKAV